MKINLFIDGKPIEGYVPERSPDVPYMLQARRLVREAISKVYGNIEGVTLNLNLLDQVQVTVEAPASFDSGVLYAIDQLVQDTLQNHKY